jgi:hypothetical protein
MSAWTEPDEKRRLQRHLRAMSAVNQQLHAQLEGQIVRSIGGAGTHGDDLLGGSVMFSGMAVGARRGGIASGWLEQLQPQGGRSGELFLARTPSREVYLVEATMRRSVKAGLLVSALQKIVGPVRDMSQSDANRYSEGPPVEVLEGGSGAPFVVVGGRRHPLRGLPLPYPVPNDVMSVLPIGEELNLSLGALAPHRSQLSRAKVLVAQQGAAGSARAVFATLRRRVRRTRAGRKA